MKKNIIFSHESDIDGLGCIILAKLAFPEIDYILLPNPEKLELVFREYIISKKLEEYERIFVTDLALYDPALTMVANSDLKDKILVFDHHKGAIEDKMDRYSFTKIVEEDEKGKRCGTELFFEYLLDKEYIENTQSLEQFVEYTRLEDTWEWTKLGSYGEKAHDLSFLLNSIGKEKYILKMIETLKNNKDVFLLDDDDMNIINDKKKEYEEKIGEIISGAEYFIDEEGNKFGVVYSDYEYRNDLSEYIRKIGNPESIKYYIVVALDKGDFGQKSYRSIDESFDVNMVAMKHGGGGHPQAAGVNITKEQKEKALALGKKEGLKFLAESKYVQ